MITVEEARRTMMQQVTACATQLLPLNEGLGCVLAGDASAPVPFPLFDVSAMDGHAIGGPDGPWREVGTLAAGETFGEALAPDACVRIFTGAAVPRGSYAVLQQERCAQREGLLHWMGGPFHEGANIRRRGESVREGDRLLAKGARLTPEAIGLLASCGIGEVSVAMPPRVSVVRTGGEFIEQGRPADGRIFSSNDSMLMAAIVQAGCRTTTAALTADDVHEELRGVLEQAVQEGDVVITTGGVSVGDHDLLPPVLEELGAAIHFHGVAQKPGKPMLFATLKGVPVFALPGNPRAVMVLFREYVQPFLNAMQGAADPGPRTERLPISGPLNVKGERSEFRAAHVSEGRVHLLADEGSHMLRTLVEANAIAYIPHDVRSLYNGDLVEVHYLPQ